MYRVVVKIVLGSGQWVGERGWNEKRPGHCPGRNNEGGWFYGLCGVPESHQGLALRAFTQLFKRPLANLADAFARYAH